jgi:flavodoxin
MKFLVAYYSKGSKTAKVAGAIANELGCEAVDVAKSKPDTSGVDILVVGTGTYGGMPGPAILEFLKGIPTATDAKAATFATSAGSGPRSLARIKGDLEAKGYVVVSSFDCRGQFMLANRGHPDEKDLENARAFARDLKK